MSSPQTRHLSGASFDRIADALTAATGPTRSVDAEWTKFCCPVHDDRHASLGIKYDPALGKTVIRCFAFCPDTDVLSALGLRVADLFDTPRTRSSTPRPAARRSSTPTPTRTVEPPAPATTTAPTAKVNAPTPARAETLGAQTGPKKQIAVYLYTSVDGDRIGQVIRTETPHENGIAKGFYQRRWDDTARRWKAKGFPPVLYRLPEVAAAIAAGTPVYVVEGEKDADNAAAAGLVATTNAQGGGRGKFKPEHAAQLIGAHVTIVADRDHTGYSHAIEVRDRLAGHAASVAVVAAATGKDLSDHLAAGLHVDQLVPIDPDAELTPTQESVTTPPPALAPVTDELVHDDTPQYGFRGGHTVHIRQKNNEIRTSTIWRCEARILASPIEDYGYTDSATRPRAAAGRTFHLTRRVTGPDDTYLRDDNGRFVTETAVVTIENDDLNSPRWPDLLPWPRLIHDTSPRGRSRALEAADLATPGKNSTHTRRYLSTGWHAIEGQNVYLHAAGAIGKNGPVLGLDQQLEGKLAQLTMEDPAPELIDMFMEKNRPFGSLLELNPAIVSPLIGFTFRSLLSPPDSSIHLVGPPGSGKTAIVRNASLNFVAARFCEDNGEHRDMFCGADNIGDTLASLMHSLHRTKDIPVLIDDFNGRKAAERLADIQRAVWNGGGRQVSTLRGTNRSGGKPRAGVITTGESSSLGSAATRTLTINVGPTDLTDDPVTMWQKLENENHRVGRAIMGATYVQWLARDLAGYRDWADRYHRSITTVWSKLCETMSHEPSVRGRLARSATLITTGWALLMRFLRDMNAVTPERADEIWDWAMGGLRDQLYAQDPTMTDGAVQIVELLRSALASGTAHITDRAGDLPCDPTDGAAGRALGWHGRPPHGPRDRTDSDPMIWQPRGNQIGILTDTEVWLYPDEAIATATTRADRAGERLPHTKTSLTDALIGRGWMKIGKEGKRRSRRRIGGVMTEVWTIPIAAFFGEDDENYSTTVDPENDFIPIPPWEFEPDAEPDPDPDDSPPHGTNRTWEAPNSETTAAPPLRLVTPDYVPPTTAYSTAVVTDTELVLHDDTRIWIEDAITTIPDLLQLTEQVPIAPATPSAEAGTLDGPELYFTAEALSRFGFSIPADFGALDYDQIDDAADALAEALSAALSPYGYRASGSVLTRLYNGSDDPTTARQHASITALPLLAAIDPTDPLTHANPDPAELARRIHAFHQAHAPSPVPAEPHSTSA